VPFRVPFAGQADEPFGFPPLQQIQNSSAPSGGGARADRTEDEGVLLLLLSELTCTRS
jgi:hypothetical protein